LELQHVVTSNFKFDQTRLRILKAVFFTYKLHFDTILAKRGRRGFATIDGFYQRLNCFKAARAAFMAVTMFKVQQLADKFVDARLFTHKA
jgi:hypothetical protein